MGLVDSWRADSQSQSMARSRNYPMCQNHFARLQCGALFLGLDLLDPWPAAFAEVGSWKLVAPSKIIVARTRTTRGDTSLPLPLWRNRRQIRHSFFRSVSSKQFVGSISVNAYLNQRRLLCQRRGSINAPRRSLMILEDARPYVARAFGHAALQFVWLSLKDATVRAVRDCVYALAKGCARNE